MTISESATSHGGMGFDTAMFRSIAFYMEECFGNQGTLRADFFCWDHLFCGVTLFPASVGEIWLASAISSYVSMSIFFDLQRVHDLLGDHHTTYIFGCVNDP